MNRIVREHYPAKRLPAELRSGLGPDEIVKVTIEPEGRAAIKSANVRKLFGIAKNRQTTIEEAVTRIRSLRNER